MVCGVRPLFVGSRCTRWSDSARLFYLFVMCTCTIDLSDQFKHLPFDDSRDPNCVDTRRNHQDLGDVVSKWVFVERVPADRCFYCCACLGAGLPVLFGGWG